MRRALIYVRISQDAGGAGLGVARQEADCRALCAKRGWTVAAVHSDNDTSAYKRKTRPGYDRLLADLEAGVGDAVVVYKPDRLHRRPVELEAFIDLVQRLGTQIATVDGGALDLTTSEGRAMARVVGTFARMESELKADRTRRKHLELAEGGHPVGGTRPFGYQADKLTIHSFEAALIRRAAQEILDGRRVRSITKEWADSGVRMPRGGRPTQTAVRRILTSPRLIGKRTLGGLVVSDAMWPAILEEKVWRQVCRELDARKPEAGGYGPRSYLLTGVLRCGKCGTRLIARPQSNRRRTYVCTSNPDKGGCGGIRIVAEALEEYVAFLACRWLDTDAVHAARADAPSETLAEVADDEAALEQLARDHYVDRLISRSEYLAARAGVEARLVAARRLVAVTEGNRRLDRYVGQGEALAARWETTGFDQRRAVIDACVETITVGPAGPGVNRFDPQRVSVRWRS